MSNADVIAGILAAAKRGPTVINLSLGYPQPDPMIEQAVLVAFGEGSIVVASAGNDFANGNPLIYPASLPHVLTVAATDESNRPTDFSSSSEAVDLSAPGQHIVAAVPLSYDPNGWQSVDGTSFSAPIVSAATAWVWTARPQLDNTQVVDLMRWSARDNRACAGRSARRGKLASFAGRRGGDRPFILAHRLARGRRRRCQ